MCIKSTELDKGKFQAQTVKTGHHNRTQLHAESIKVMFIAISTQTCYFFVLFLYSVPQSSCPSKSAESYL